MNDIKVSIVIPLFNGERFLKETIDSCLEQNYKNIEIVLIDDCSTDNSRNIINNYKNKNMIQIQNEKNLGINRTVNKAVNYCNGDYLLILGHDDKLPYDHISKIMKEFDDQTVLVYCNSIIIDSTGKQIRVTYNDNIQINKNRKLKFENSKRNIISSTGLIMKKKSFSEVGGFDESFKNFGEWLLWLKLSNKGKIKYSSLSRAYYRQHETNITNSFKNTKVKNELLKYFDYTRTYAYKNLFRDFTLMEKIKFYAYYKYQKIKAGRPK